MDSDAQPPGNAVPTAVIPPRQVSWRPRTVAVLVVSDAAMLLTGTLAAAWVRFGDVRAHVALEDATVRLNYAELAVLSAAIWLVFLAAEGLYDLDRLFWGAGEFTRVVRGLTTGVVASILVTYALGTLGVSRVWTLNAWVLCIVLVISGRLVVRGLMEHMRRAGRLSQRTLVVGSNAEASDIIRILATHPGSGLVPVGCVASSQAERLDLDYCSGRVPVLGDARELRHLVTENDIEVIVIASSAFRHEVLGRMIAELRGMPVTIHVSSGLFEVLTSRVSVREVGGIPLIAVRTVSLSRGRLAAKRAFDIAVAGLMAILGLPAWLVVMLAVATTSRGPVLYSQERVGRGGHTFGMLKFRSMIAEADERKDDLANDNEASGPLFKMREDPRVTPVGRFLRKYSIDEIPQLINVLKGEMSLVGPRPPLPDEVVHYNEHHWRRMEVLPGMTGLWQVSGRSNLGFEDMVRLDLFYIENWSVTLDIGILVRTVPTVLSAHGAY